MQNNTFNTLVLFPTGICNLNCRYCGIDKNPALQQIDAALGASFEGTYYQEQIKKYFPDTYKLEELQTWGGEPFIHLERIYPIVEWLIDEYPYFYHFYSSTNFSYPEWLSKLYGLLDIFNKYDYRNFTFTLQLSCDGPEYINDRNRGKGTTKKCLENFNKLVETIADHVGPNVTLMITVKGTLNIDDLYDLNTKEKIIEYYRFYEDNFMRPIIKLGRGNIQIAPPVPNTAVPEPILKQDGQYFAKYCRMTKEIEQENIDCHYFQYYKYITMFKDVSFTFDNAIQTYHHTGCTCGVGMYSLGLLPNGMITSCHEGFTNFAMEYKDYAKTSNRLQTGTINFDDFIDEREITLCMTPEKFEYFSEIMHCYDTPGSTVRFVTLTTQIQILAMCGQIDEKYADYEKALKVATYVAEHGMHVCVKDNYNITGSITLEDHGIFKLFLNGAIDEITNEDI